MGGASVGKVVAFVTRHGPTGAELLVLDHPNAGVQAPAGTIEAAESPLDRARRETWEEAGLDEVRLVAPLGQRNDGPGGEGVRCIFHFAGEIDTTEVLRSPHRAGAVRRPSGDSRAQAGRPEPVQPAERRARCLARRSNDRQGPRNPRRPGGHRPRPVSHLRAGDIWAGVRHGNDRRVALLGRPCFERVAELDHHSRFRLPLSGRA